MFSVAWHSLNNADGRKTCLVSQLPTLLAFLVYIWLWNGILPVLKLQQMYTLMSNFYWYLDITRFSLSDNYSQFYFNTIPLIWTDYCFWFLLKSQHECTFNVDSLLSFCTGRSAQQFPIQLNIVLIISVIVATRTWRMMCT